MSWISPIGGMIFGDLRHDSAVRVIGAGGRDALILLADRFGSIHQVRRKEKDQARENDDGSYGKKSKGGHDRRGHRQGSTRCVTAWMSDVASGPAADSHALDMITRFWWSGSIHESNLAAFLPGEPGALMLCLGTSPWEFMCKEGRWEGGTVHLAPLRPRPCCIGTFLLT